MEHILLATGSAHHLIFLVLTRKLFFARDGDAYCKRWKLNHCSYSWIVSNHLYVVVEQLTATYWHQYIISSHRVDLQL